MEPKAVRYPVCALGKVLFSDGRSPFLLLLPLLDLFLSLLPFFYLVLLNVVVPGGVVIGGDLELGAHELVHNDRAQVLPRPEAEGDSGWLPLRLESLYFDQEIVQSKEGLRLLCLLFFELSEDAIYCRLEVCLAGMLVDTEMLEIVVIDLLREVVINRRRLFDVVEVGGRGGGRGRGQMSWSMSMSRSRSRSRWRAGELLVLLFLLS